MRVLADGKGGGVGEMGRSAHLGSRATLQLGFDPPWEIGATAFLEDQVVAFGVDLFGVKKEAVHVEETGAYFGESGGYGQSKQGMTVKGDTYSGFAIIMFAVLMPKQSYYSVARDVMNSGGILAR